MKAAENSDIPSSASSSERFLSGDQVLNRLDGNAGLRWCVDVSCTPPISTLAPVDMESFSERCVEPTCAAGVGCTPFILSPPAHLSNWPAQSRNFVESTCFVDVDRGASILLKRLRGCALAERSVISVSMDWSGVGCLAEKGDLDLG